MPFSLWEDVFTQFSVSGCLSLNHLPSSLVTRSKRTTAESRGEKIEKHRDMHSYIHGTIQKQIHLHDKDVSVPHEKTNS